MMLMGGISNRAKWILISKIHKQIHAQQEYIFRWRAHAPTMRLSLVSRENRGFGANQLTGMDAVDSTQELVL